MATEYVNNHIHTTYSFSPYSPAQAAQKAADCGLTTAGIMDHDSVGGSAEFLAAAKRAGIGGTNGFECRVKMDATPFAGRRLNNPDQLSVAYVACHGIPRQNIEQAQAWLAPVREKRNRRNRAMVENINGLLAGSGVMLDFDADVLPISNAAKGGSVTERHLLYALAGKLVAAKGKGAPLLAFLKEALGLEPGGGAREKLADADSPGYAYTLLGVLKSSLVQRFYIPADEECYPVAEFVDFARAIGAIPAYAYLGDVGNSVTGDKAAQAFEDAFLDELVPWLKEAGFLSVTYMPTRNTPAQLQRVMALCDANGLFQISGEDINSPAQSFRCEALALPAYSHLVVNTWALIGHELAATANLADGMFAPKAQAEWPELGARIQHYARLGHALSG